MSTLIIYLIKANIALSLFYLAYRFGLRRLTFYTLNRYFLLFGIAFSALFPLVNVSAFFQQHQELTGSITYYAPDWNTLQYYIQPEKTVVVWNLIRYIFWTGAVLMTIRFIIQLLSLLRIHIRSTDGMLCKEKVKLMRDRINPFSFLKTIYINPSLHGTDELQTILRHEKIHIQEWHTIDILAGEVNTIFYWFNPGAWLMKTAIRENLEFITDRQLLHSGINAKTYQYSLLKAIKGLNSVQVAHNFNLARLKQRIMMMNKKQSSGFHLFRYLLLPLVAILAIVCTSSSIQDKNDFSKINTTAPQVRKDTIHDNQIRNDPKDYRDFLKRNPSVNYLTWSDPVNGKATKVRLYLKNGKRESYHLNDPEEMKSAIAKYRTFPVPPPPPPESVNTKTHQSDSEGKTDSLPLSKQPLYIIDNQVDDSANIQDLDPSAIQSISIFKGEKAIKKYGKKGKNGVILIYTKSYAKDHPKQFKNKTGHPGKKKNHTSPKYAPDSSVNKSNKPETLLSRAPGLKQISSNKNNKPKTRNLDIYSLTLFPSNTVFIVNGKKVNKDYVMTSLKPSEIESIKLERNLSNTNLYGEVKAVKIYTKNPKKKANHPRLLQSRKKNTTIHEPTVEEFLETKPLYIIDGKVGKINNLEPEDIHSITVLKGEAVKKYGEKGKNGVILIHTKTYRKAHLKADTSMNKRKKRS